MPLYEYQCPTCSGLETAFRKVDERNDGPMCPVCNVKTVKIISGYSVVPDVQPYYDDNLQTHIKSKQHRKKVMRDQGVSEKFGKGWM